MVVLYTKRFWILYRNKDLKLLIVYVIKYRSSGPHSVHFRYAQSFKDLTTFPIVLIAIQKVKYSFILSKNGAVSVTQLTIPPFRAP